MSIASQLYKDGVLIREFRDTPALTRLFEKISEMNNSPSGKFHWKMKYPGTEDFRPNVYEYDSSFLDVLFESEVSEMIKNSTHKNLCLAHIQLRRVFPGPSYMSWHRDTHFKDSDVVSSSPPAYKIIFFPDINNNKLPCISMLKGSHLCHMVNQRSDSFISPGFSQFDKQILDSGMFENITLSSSKRQFAFFDTSIMHSAASSADSNGSIRLIYVFIDKDQFEKTFAKKPEHRNLNKIFQERIKNG